MFSLALYLCCVNSSLIIKYMLLNFIVYIAVYCFCFNIKKVVNLLNFSLCKNT